jgi:sec-independent protein translocase protein TatA
MVAGIGPPEIILILLVLVLLFGAKKLPELARGSGRALRIFKAETKGLLDDEDDSKKTPEQRQIDAQRSAEAAARVESAEEQPRPDSER